MSLFSRLRSRARSAGREPDTLPVDLAPREFVQGRSQAAPVLDVRTAGEFAARHLEGARNLDILEDGFMARLEELGLDLDQPVYLYCRSGNRSGHAARLLRKNGYARAFNVGGLEELVREGAPTRS